MSAGGKGENVGDVYNFIMCETHIICAERVIIAGGNIILYVLMRRPRRTKRIN